MARVMRRSPTILPTSSPPESWPRPWHPRLAGRHHRICPIRLRRAPLPTGPDAAPACPTGGAGLAIPAKLSEERKVNALKFIAFVTNPTNTAYFSQQTGYLPVRKSAVDDASERHYLADNPRARVALDQLPHTRTQDYARVFLPGGDRIISAGLESIGLRGADVTKTFTNIQKRLQVILDRQIMRKLAGHG